MRYCGCRPAAFKFRNFDPETGLARKHARTEEEETVEKQTDGLADQVIAEDQQARQQELVRFHSLSSRDVVERILTFLFATLPLSSLTNTRAPLMHTFIFTLVGSDKYSTEEGELGFEARFRTKSRFEFRISRP